MQAQCILLPVYAKHTVSAHLVLHCTLTDMQSEQMLAAQHCAVLKLFSTKISTCQWLLKCRYAVPFDLCFPLFLGFGLEVRCNHSFVKRALPQEVVSTCVHCIAHSIPCRLTTNQN